VWSTLDEVHLITKERKKRRQAGSMRDDGVDEDAAELADVELLLLDDVLGEGRNVDLREPHEAFTALATVASASRHGSTPMALSRKASAAASSAELMAKTPLSRRGTARSDAGAASSFRLGVCPVDDGTGALLMGGHGGTGLLGAGDGVLGMGGSFSAVPMAPRGGALADASGGLMMIGALSFDQANDDAATRSTAHADDGMGFGDAADGGDWYQEDSAPLPLAATRARKPRGLASLWGTEDVEDETDPLDDPWLLLRPEDADDSVLSEAQAAGTSGVLRRWVERPMRGGKTTSRPKNAAGLARDGVDDMGGVAVPTASLAHLALSGAPVLTAIGQAPVASSKAAWSLGASRLSQATGLPSCDTFSVTSAQPTLAEFAPAFGARKAAHAKARLARARAANAASSSAAAAAVDEAPFFGDDAGMGAFDDGYEDDEDDARHHANDDDEAAVEEDGQAAARAVLFSGADEDDVHLAPVPASASLGSYEAMVLKYRDEFLQSAQSQVRASALSKRVAEWTDAMMAALEQDEARGEFDVHVYGQGVLQALEGCPTMETGVPFQQVLSEGENILVAEQSGEDDEDEHQRSVALGSDSAQVARSFLALLQLANEGNVELDHAESGAGTMDDLCVRLLHSRAAAQERFAQLQGTQAATPSKQRPSKKRLQKEDMSESAEEEEEAPESGGRGRKTHKSGARSTGDTPHAKRVTLVHEDDAIAASATGEAPPRRKKNVLQASAAGTNQTAARGAHKRTAEQSKEDFASGESPQPKTTKTTRASRRLAARA
jgi:hypothetical protein